MIDQTTQRTQVLQEKLQYLQRIATAAATGSSDIVINEATLVLKQMLGVEQASMQLVDETGENLKFVATLDSKEWPILQSMVIPIDEPDSISSSVAREGNALKLDDTWAHPVFGERQRRFSETKDVGNRSYICVPLKSLDKTIGVINVVHAEKDRFSDEDLILTSVLASVVTMSIRHFQLLERLALVAEVVLSLDLQVIYSEIIGQLKQMLGVEQASMQLVDETGENLKFVATLDSKEWPILQSMVIPIDEPDSISSSVAREGNALKLDDTWAHPVFGERQRRFSETKDVGNRSYICVPLKSLDKTIGVINVVHAEKDRFSDEDLFTVTVFATFAASAITNSTQMEQLLEAKEMQDNMEHATAMADFTNNFSHTINGKLGLIGQYVVGIERRLKKGNLTDDYIKEKMSLIKEAVGETTAVVGSLKKFEMTSGEMVQVSSCVKKAIFNLQFYKKTFGEDLDRIVQVFDMVEDDSVYATQQLVEVFTNLIRNSLDAMRNQISKEIVISLRDDYFDDYLTILFTDTGPGVSEEIRNRLFKLGATTKPKAEGGGYGLWWIRTWLYRRGGSIEYDPSFDQGARFIITIPQNKQVLASIGKDNVNE